MLKKGRILKIEEHDIVIGFEDGSIANCKLESFNYVPRVNDSITIYGDLDGEHVITKAGMSMPNMNGLNLGGFNFGGIKREDVAPMDPNVPINKVAYLVAAFAGGTFGIHKFLTGRTVQGVVYLLLSMVLGISTLLGIIEGFMALNQPTDENGKFIPRSMF